MTKTLQDIKNLMDQEFGNLMKENTRLSGENTKLKEEIKRLEVKIKY